MLGRYRPLNTSAQARDDAMLLVNRSGLDELFEDAINATTGWRSSYRYTVRAVLTGMVIAVAVGKPTVKTMAEEVWHLAGDQEWIEWAGMQRITPEGSAALEADLSDRLFWREVDLFRRVYEAMHDTIDDSPFPRGRRETQRERAKIRRKLAAHPELQAELAEKDDRFFIAINAFPGVASDPGHWRPSSFNGSLAVDETLAHTRIPTRAHDGANIHANQGPEADATFHYDKDIPEHYNWDFRVQTAVPAGDPYGRWPPSIVAGIHILHDIGEDDGDGALAAVRAAILNGWGPSRRGHPICFADAGIGREDSFARGIWKLGYQPSLDQQTADRVKLIQLFTDAELSAFPRTRSGRVKVPVRSGAFLLRGEWLCPGGEELIKFRNALAPKFVKLNDPVPPGYAAELSETAAAADAFAAHTMKQRRRPIVDDSDPDPEKHTVSLVLECPVMHGSRCPLKPWSMERDPATHPTILSPPTGYIPQCCEQESATYHMDAKLIKYTDAYVRFSFKHEDAYNWNRGNNERGNSWYQKPSLGHLDTAKIEVFGRARVGMLISIAFAFANLRAIERHMRQSGSPDNLPFNVRSRYQARRDRLITEFRNARVSPLSRPLG